MPVPAGGRDGLRPDARGAERGPDAARDRSGRAPRGDPVAGARHRPTRSFARTSPAHTRCSRRRRDSGCGASCGRRARRRSGYRSSGRPTTRRSTRRTCTRRRATRSRRCSARRWRASSAAGAGCRSSACGSRTSWSAPTTSSSRRTGTTRICASGTCGATSTRATSTQSVRLALEADIDGADNFIIAAADTVMKRPSRELMAEVFPGVPVADDVERQRHAARHRQGARRARLCARVQLARAVPGLSRRRRRGQPSGRARAP